MFLIKIFQQFIKFGLVGGVNTLLTYIIYLMMCQFFSPTISIAVGYGITTIIGLIINKLWVFNNDSRFYTVIWKYYLVYISSWFLTIVITSVLTRYTNTNHVLIPLLTLSISIPFNFIFSKIWVFK